MCEKVNKWYDTDHGECMDDAICDRICKFSWSVLAYDVTWVSRKVISFHLKKNDNISVISF